MPRLNFGLGDTYWTSLNNLHHAGRLRHSLRSFLFYFARTALIVLPLVAVAVAADQRWNSGRTTWAVLGFGLLTCAALPLLRAALGLGETVRSALTLDQHAQLKDRVSSAYA